MIVTFEVFQSFSFFKEVSSVSPENILAILVTFFVFQLFIPSNEDNEVFYGKGWNYTKMSGLKLVFHGGQVETGITYMFILPEEQLAVCFMLNGNDEFVTNSLMDNAIWDSLAIIKGEPTKAISHSAYIVRHAVYDALYLLVFALSLLILIKAIKAKDGIKPAGAAKAKAVIFNAAAYILWPLFLLTAIKIFFDTPLWVVRQFVPDLYFVILISAAFAFTGGIFRIINAACHTN